MSIRLRLTPITQILLIAFLFVQFHAARAQAQDDSGDLQFVNLDATNFPEMVVWLSATDAGNNAITDPTGLVLQEDGSPVGAYEAEVIDPGSEMIVIIDANTTIEDRDGTELSRREKVRDSLIRYANHFMDPMQKDRVTIIVPEGQEASFLEKTDMAFPNEVINSVNFYQTGELGETNIDGMFQLALDFARSNQEQGRHQSIVLFSDAASLGDQLDLEGIAGQAAEQGVAIYGVILGSFADAEETGFIRRLSDPTGGTYVHMPDAVLADPIYEAIQQRASQLAITFRSRLDSSGPHAITAELNGVLAEASIDITVEPAHVQLAVDNSRPIRRVAETVDTPLELMLPTEQPLVAQVDWPDAHPRKLVSAELLLRDVPMPVDQVILDDSGLLTFSWDISQLDEGVYDLQVQITDELGLQAVSDPLPLTIVVERPIVVVSTTGEPVITPSPTVPPPAITVQPESEPLGIAMIVGGAVLLLILIIVVVTALVILRRRSESEDTSVRPRGYAQPIAGAEYTYVVPPEFAGAEGVGAYLEVLENAPEHQQLIPLAGNNIALGRDSRRVQIVFADRSVSRLHARILESRGEFRIYEEGSSSGTYVNFERLGLTPRTLQDMDRIHLGRVHLRFHLASSMRKAAVSSTGPETEIGIPGI